MNPLLEIRKRGQQIWLTTSPTLINDGELARLVAEDGLAGVTTNPAIFQRRSPPRSLLCRRAQEVLKGRR